MLLLPISSISRDLTMWLFKRPMAVSEAAEEVSRLVRRLPLRLRDRVVPLGLPSSDGFELEGIALAYAIAVFAIEDSKFSGVERDLLQDRFTVVYADQILRMRLTLNLYERHQPLEAVEAGNTMRGMRLTSHDQLDRINLQDLLLSRLSAYRQGNLEDKINRFLAYLEASQGFDLKFSLAVFLTDSTTSVRDKVDGLSRQVYLV